MGSPNHLIYLETVLPNFNGKVLEVGANNNKFRHKGYFQNLGAEYTGTDLVPGPDVDVDCDLTRDDNPLPKNHYDLVMCQTPGTWLDAYQHWWHQAANYISVCHGYGDIMRTLMTIIDLLLVPLSICFQISHGVILHTVQNSAVTYAGYNVAKLGVITNGPTNMCAMTDKLKNTCRT